MQKISLVLPVYRYNMTMFSYRQGYFGSSKLDAQSQEQRRKATIPEDEAVATIFIPEVLGGRVSVGVMRRWNSPSLLWGGESTANSAFS